MNEFERARQRVNNAHAERKAKEQRGQDAESERVANIRSAAAKILDAVEVVAKEAEAAELFAVMITRDPSQTTGLIIVTPTGDLSFDGFNVEILLQDGKWIGRMREGSGYRKMATDLGRAGNYERNVRSMFEGSIAPHVERIARIKE